MPWGNHALRRFKNVCALRTQAFRTEPSGASTHPTEALCDAVSEYKERGFLGSEQGLSSQDLASCGRIKELVREAIFSVGTNSMASHLLGMYSTHVLSPCYRLFMHQLKHTLVASI